MGVYKIFFAFYCMLCFVSNLRKLVNTSKSFPNSTIQQYDDVCHVSTKDKHKKIVKITILESKYKKEREKNIQWLKNTATTYKSYIFSSNVGNCKDFKKSIEINLTYGDAVFSYWIKTNYSKTLACKKKSQE